MKSGKLALLNSETEDLESDRYEYKLPDNSPFDTVASTIRVEDTLTLNNGLTCFTGQAAQEDVQTVDNPKVTDSGEIEEGETIQKITHVTSFILVPDEFAIVENSAGEFLFPMLNEQTSHSAFPAEIDVDRFSADYTDAEYWKVGFTGRGDGAENGVLHGGTVLNDSELGNVVGKSTKNQLGLSLEHNGYSLKLFVTESGYVNIYNEYEIDEFADFFLDVLHDYTRME